MAKLFIAMFKNNSPIFLFLFCPEWHFVKEVSFIFFLVTPNLFGHVYMSKKLPHEQVQIYLPSQSSLVIFQSFCQTESFVKEVLARSTQMS